MNKKKILALLLSGAMIVGGGILAIPATAQAVKFESCNDSSSHVNSSQVAIVDGKLTVTIDISFELDKGTFGLYVFTEKLVKKGEFIYLDMNDASRVAKLEDLKDSGTYTFDGLAGGTYYVYCRVEDNHECNEWGEGGDKNETLLHDAVYLGSAGSNGSSSGSSSSGGASSGSSNASASVSYEDTVATQIETAESGSTVVMEEGISALSNSTMKELLAKGDVSLRMEFTYQDKEYVIIIPAGAALDNDIPWYGPLYLAQHFGNSAGTAGSGAGGTYEVKPGDSLSRIAAASNMTLQQLLAKNPQIKDPNKIIVGQKINR